MPEAACLERARRTCAEPGCPDLVVNGRCAKHRGEADRERGTAAERGYTWKWSGYSKRWLRAHPICGMRVDLALHAEHSRCVQTGRMTGATVTDHIVPVNDGGPFWDKHNHQSLCASCHGAKDGERRFGR